MNQVEAECACCGQSWLVLPGDVESSISPDCQERLRKAAAAAKRAKSKALKTLYG